VDAILPGNQYEEEELHMKLARLALIAVVAAVALPGISAAATSPVFDQYGNPVATQTEQPGANVLGVADAPAADTVGGLPFTGAELSYVAFAALFILGSGVMLHRVGSKQARRRQSGTSAA
jgi:hypothetical protein